MQWDLYCRVVDNLGDVGTAWRFAADVAGRGDAVRLAIDDASALAWMAPQGVARVEVVGWSDGPSASPDVVVELFGAHRPARPWREAPRPPVLINLEHLSAEAYVERSHALPSPAQRPGEPPTTTWFFYPGFTTATGGLLREPGLLAQRRAFGGGEAWLASIGIAPRAGERRVSLFCYSNDAIPELLEALAGSPTLLLLAPGAATDRVAELLGASLARGGLRALRLPLLAQVDFDRLLWSCQLNLVRGEDSFVRAFWAGVPFVWQAYVQDDGAHLAKVTAFLDRFLAGTEPALAARVRAIFGRWNGAAQGTLAGLAEGGAWMADWAAHCERWRDLLSAQEDLLCRLIGFVEAKR